MFKKFKDKLAEEVKSSPQRIQQFAQAAQAAVTSASSSISDITNNDLFSIGDNDATNKSRPQINSQQNSFQDVALIQSGDMQPITAMDFSMNEEIALDHQRQRRLSNSSFASDISFRLPSYESPSMYHLQSDMEVSASEAEDKGFPGGTVNLDRVTKEQLYSAYRRTQDRCTKYKTQYADLARHYKLLERENAKARNVLVETQDKALRRISELREQCSLEQSAKAHLEKALREEIEEKNIKIETLNTQLSFLRSDDNLVNSQLVTCNSTDDTIEKHHGEALLVNLTVDNHENKPVEESTPTEVMVLNNKIEKMEQLLNKYKDSLKTTKEKNSQLTTELQIITSELDAKGKENDKLKAAAASLADAKKKIQDLNETIEDLQNKNNTLEFSKQKDISILELNLKNAQEEIHKLRDNIQTLSKREEEYAISLAENKLSIHKELESKEKEIKSLKDSFADSQKEIQSLNILSSEFKNNVSRVEEERDKLKNEISNLNEERTKLVELKVELETLAQKCQALENVRSKSEEEYKCLQLQMKQETGEKLAMIDRNTYLENRNSHLLEENTKKSSQINQLGNELESLKTNIKHQASEESDEIKKYIEEVDVWKLKCSKLESEILEERVELVKLHSEIEKLLANYELVQKLNQELNSRIDKLNSEHILLNKQASQTHEVKEKCRDLQNKVFNLQELISITLKETKTLKQFTNTHLQLLKDKVDLLEDVSKNNIASKTKDSDNLKQTNETLLLEIQTISDKLQHVSSELKQAMIENSNLKLTLNQSESDSIIQVQKIGSLNDEYQAALKESSILKDELDKTHSDIKQSREEAVSTKKELELLKEEKDELNKTLVLRINETESLKEQINKKDNLYKDVVQNLNDTTKEINELRNMKTNYEDKCNKAAELQKRIEELSAENISLKKSSETVTNILKGIQSELNEVRNSHTEMEKERDHLNSIVENLDKRAADVCNQNTQTEKMFDKELQEQEINILRDANKKLTQENEQHKTTISQTDDILMKLNDVMNNYDVLKEEKRRLQSEIEGLQAHLTKVSQENSRLNDSMRELIAGSDNDCENKSEKSSHELQCLKDEVGAGREKIDNLIRENTLLAEENLELKDQMNNQTSSKVSNVSEGNKFLSNDNSRDKLDDLMNTNRSLEKQVTDLELINQSVSGNMQQVQTNNEKLRLSNDKLERRLDEALVSLRHLHSLQENTELEYLKNILYEYLTGSGTHSITLAKVLAAVVKFDDRQTEAVLQKEKERQGILRQLGII